MTPRQLTARMLTVIHMRDHGGARDGGSLAMCSKRLAGVMNRRAHLTKVKSASLRRLEMFQTHSDVESRGVAGRLPTAADTPLRKGGSSDSRWVHAVPYLLNDTQTTHCPDAHGHSHGGPRGRTRRGLSGHVQQASLLESGFFSRIWDIFRYIRIYPLESSRHPM